MALTGTTTVCKEFYYQALDIRLKLVKVWDDEHCAYHAYECRKKDSVEAQVFGPSFEQYSAANDVFTAAVRELL